MDVKDPYTNSVWRISRVGIKNFSDTFYTRMAENFVIIKTYVPLRGLSQRVNFLTIPSRYNGSRECNDVTCHAHVEGMEKNRENAMRGLESTPCWIAANRAPKYDGCCTRRIISSSRREKSNRNEVYLPLGAKHVDMIFKYSHIVCKKSTIKVVWHYFLMI